MSIDPHGETRTRVVPGPEECARLGSGASAGLHSDRRPGRLASALAVIGASAALVILGGVGLGCGSDSSDPHRGEPLAAPTGLEAMLAQPGVHLSWQDRSTGEEEFMILRREGTAGYAEIGRAGANVTSFHDGSARSGATYTYVVHAMNMGGTSAPSNEATIAVP